MVGRLALRQLADRGLARRTEQHRAAEAVQQGQPGGDLQVVVDALGEAVAGIDQDAVAGDPGRLGGGDPRSEEHTSELQSLMRISYAVFCLNKKTQQNKQ